MLPMSFHPQDGDLVLILHNRMVFSNIKSALRESRFWLLANALGISIYLLVQYGIMAPRPEWDELNFVDIFFYWLSYGVPIIVVSMIVDLVWLILIIKNRSLCQNWISQIEVWLLVCLAWGIALFAYGLTLPSLKIIVISLRAASRR